MGIPENFGDAFFEGGKMKKEGKWKAKTMESIMDIIGIIVIIRNLEVVNINL